MLFYRNSRDYQPDNSDVNAREGATLGVRILEVGLADTFLAKPRIPIGSLGIDYKKRGDAKFLGLSVPQVGHLVIRE
jgi:hypothetical protein